MEEGPAVSPTLHVSPNDGATHGGALTPSLERGLLGTCGRAEGCMGMLGLSGVGWAAVLRHHGFLLPSGVDGTVPRHPPFPSPTSPHSLRGWGRACSRVSSLVRISSLRGSFFLVCLKPSVMKPL